MPGEPRLNTDRTRVVCGWRFADGQECQEWLGRWNGLWSDDIGPDDPAPTGPLTIRAGFRLVDGVWRESADGRRRRARNIKYRSELRPPALYAGFAEHTFDFVAESDHGPAIVICPACRQQRRLDPQHL